MQTECWKLKEKTFQVQDEWKTVGGKSCIGEKMTCTKMQNKAGKVCLLSLHAHLQLWLNKEKDIYILKCINKCNIWQYTSFCMPLLCNRFHPAGMDKLHWPDKTDCQLKTIKYFQSWCYICDLSAALSLHISIHTLTYPAVCLSFLMTSSLTTFGSCYQTPVVSSSPEESAMSPRLSALSWYRRHVVYLINYISPQAVTLTHDPFKGLRSKE